MKYSWLPSKPKLIVIIMVSVIVIIGILMILYAWQLPPFFRHRVVTNDAYIQAKTTLLSSQISGYVDKIYVQDFENVKRNQALIKIDDRIYKQKVEEALASLKSSQVDLKSYEKNYQLYKANVAEKQALILSIQANYENAKSEAKRNAILASKGGISQRENELTQAKFKSTRANLIQAKAQYQKALKEFEAYKISKAGLIANVQRNYALLKQALINLDYTLIRAPQDGKLSEIGSKLGEYIKAGDGVVFIIPNTRYIIANFKETKLSKIKIGARVSFSVDALPKLQFKGIVEEISPAMGSEFSSIKVNNATGNFIKVIQRIPVKIKITDPKINQLKAGMSVVVSIYDD